MSGYQDVWIMSIWEHSTLGRTIRSVGSAHTHSAASLEGHRVQYYVQQSVVMLVLVYGTQEGIMLLAWYLEMSRVSRSEIAQMS